MLTIPSFKKSLIVEQFQGNYLKPLPRDPEASELTIRPPRLLLAKAEDLHIKQYLLSLRVSLTRHLACCKSSASFLVGQLSFDN